MIVTIDRRHYKTSSFVLSPVAGSRKILNVFLFDWFVEVLCGHLKKEGRTRGDAQ